MRHRIRRPSAAISRRTLLQALGLGAGAAFLPSLLPGRARADSPGAARRIIFFVTSHGTVYKNWRMRPAAQPDDQDWEFGLGATPQEQWSPILAPLYAHRDKLLVLDGVANGAGSISGINEHESGHASALTGRVAKDVEGSLALPDGPSVDQVIAEHLGADNIVRSLEYSIGGWPVCFDELGQTIPYEGSPQEAYKRIFPNGPEDPDLDPTEAQRIVAAQPSVLDLVGERYEALYPKLSSADRTKIEQHRALIRDLELQLAGLADVDCEVPQPPGPNPMWGAPTYPAEMASVFFGLTQVALSCGLTQVVTIRHDTMFNETVGAPPGDLHNDFAHQGSTDPEAGQIMTNYQVHQAERFRELIAALDSIPEGEGTMLDHTVCVWDNELSTGEHSMVDLPIVIAGGGDYYDLGRYVHWRKGDVLKGPWSDIPMGPAHNKLLTVLARSMGVEVESFGLDTLPRVGGGEISTTGLLDRVTV